MSDIKDIKKAYEKTEEMGRKIWLAGLGAYGQSFDSVTNNCEKVNSETRSLFEKLVARGEELESSTLKSINETRENATKMTTSKIQEQKEKILGQRDKIVSKAEKLQTMAKESISLDKIKPENITLESVTETINNRLDEIRNKVNDLIPAMASREEVEKLNERVDELAAAPKATKPKTTRAPRAKKAAAPKAAAKTAKSQDAE